MKKIGNKFIICVIFIIALIVASQTYIAYSQSNRDTNSYLTLMSGNGTINDIRLNENEPVVLATADEIRVIWESSLALIEWWDGSMTRLGWNTKITIEQNEISRDYTKINISFDLIAWKTWSNIVSFIWSDSSFTQTFDGIEAWVRGTVFDVDLDKNFIHASDHSIEVTNQEGEIFILPEGSVLHLETFNLIDFTKYLTELQDSAWNEINKKLDLEYFQELKLDLQSSMRASNPLVYIMRFLSPKYATLYVLDTYQEQEDVNQYFNSMSQKDKIKVYDDVLSAYQEMNFVSPGDNEYETKMRYKKALVSLDVDNWNTQRLVVTAAYDLQDIIDSWNTEDLSTTLWFINKHVESLDSDNLNVLKWGLNYVPEGLLNEFSESFNSLWEVLNINFSTIKTVNSGTIGDILDSADSAIKWFLDDNVGGLIQQFSN